MEIRTECYTFGYQSARLAFEGEAPRRAVERLPRQTARVTQQRERCN